MKKITLAVFALLVNCLHAQKILLSEDFEDNDISQWTNFSYTPDNDQVHWYIDEINNNKALSSSSTTSEFVENWFISPKINLSDVTGEVMLTMKVLASKSGKQGDNCFVAISEANTPDDFLMSRTFLSVNNLFDEDFKEFSLNLNSFKGKEIYIGFNHSNVFYTIDEITIDDILLTENTTTASTKDFLAKSIKIYHNKVTKELTIHNNLNITRVSIYNVLGKKIQSQETSNISNVNIKTNQLGRGIYILKFNTDKGVVSKKVKI